MDVSIGSDLIDRDCVAGDAMTTPRLFYWEEAVDAWCPAPDHVESIIGVENFSEDNEVIEIQFKRFDMTDEEYNNLPDD